MKLNEIRELVRLGRPEAPYGVRCLSRCYTVEDVAALARRRLPVGAQGYLDGGGQDELTLRRNRRAFDEIEFLPRVLRDVSRIDTEHTVLGERMPLPIMLSPTGAPRMFHHEGELAVARAAGRAGVPYGVSTLATQPLASVAEVSNSPLWFQLDVWGDRGIAKDLLARAQTAGYRVLVLTVDSPVRAERGRELHRGVTLPSPRLAAGTVLDGLRHPRWTWRFLTSPAPSFPNLATCGRTSRQRLGEMFDGSMTWEDLGWIRQAWSGPIVVKGLLRAEDACRAADAGVDAVIVSNHGGRQLDHSPATIEALPRVVDEVGDRAEVFFDSGIRRGSDVVAALALGARAVLVGRAHLYGLAAAGEAGVRHVIDILAAELRTTMALVGASRITDLDRDLVRKGPMPL